MQKFRESLFLGFFSQVMSVILGAASIGAILGVFGIIDRNPTLHQEKQIVYFSVLVGFATQFIFLRRFCDNKVVNFLFSAITLGIAITIMLKF